MLVFTKKRFSMKVRLLATLSLLLLCLIASAQNFRSIPSTGARWKMDRMEAEPTNPQCQQSLGYFLNSDGDTTISGITGTILRPGASAVCSNLGFGCNPQPLGGIVHQDSLGRLYLLETNGSLWPLMDFSLNPGDTMTSFHPSLGTFSYLVNAVDTVTYADGISRRRLAVNCNGCFINSSNDTYWVEGIGDLYHGPIPIIEFENWLNMLCYNEDGLFLTDGWLQNSQCSADCDLLAGISIANSPKWQVWPNPSNGEWMLDLEPGLEGSELQILGMDGRLVWNKTMHEIGTVRISMPELPAAAYLLRITLQGQEIGHSILLKE
jgi:hypothetical protein